MKNRTKKSMLQKIIITILTILLLSNFIMPTYSHADIGGVLLTPITDLLCSLGDAVINLLQKCMMGVSSGTTGINFGLNPFMVDDNEYFANKVNNEQQLKAEVGHTEQVDVDELEKGWLGVSNKFQIPVATYSPEQIFAGNVSGLDINFIHPDESKFGTTTDKDGNEIVDSSSGKLQSTIATWYVALRNLTVVGLLSVLVYVGIRIILSSSASDKAKYKQMLTDWLVALCLVFFLHYIMSFVLTMTESIVTAIGGDGATNVSVELINYDGSDTEFKTNLLGLARFKTQYKEFFPKLAYLIMYLALVVYTCIFTWFYLKRLLMMAFLTLIAPVVALTYPIDKMNDGKAQAFDSWLKEYVFNALIQPFHLIIYMVFVGTAMDLASTNIIYMIAALGFILPAEKILRRFFGFDKATAGTLGTLAGAAAVGSLAKRALSGGKGGKSSNGGKQTPEGNKPPRFENGHDVAQIEEGTGQQDNNQEQQDDGQTALDRYSAEGFGQNANGEYYNPWTDEYDADYDPREDAAYAQQNNNNNNNDVPVTPNERNNNEEDGNNRLTNWARAHNINGRSVRNLAGRAARFATRTTFRAGAGTLAAAVTLASGGGFAGAAGAFAVGTGIGGRLGNAAINAGEALGNGVGRFGRVARATSNYLTRPSRFDPNMQQERLEAIQDAAFGGTRIGRELDLANGNTRYQTAGQMRAFKNNQNNLNYVRDEMAAQNGGIIPSAREVRDKMDTLDPYMKEGLTDIKQMLRAQKVEQYGISSKQSAIIAAIGKEKGITADILNDDKKARAQQANLQQQFINKGYSKENAAKQADYTMNVLKAQNGVAHNLQKPQEQRTKK